ncbi:MAG: hypothetical protein AB8B92_11275 [Gammaproteobacteria bacterium]
MKFTLLITLLMFLSLVVVQGCKTKEEAAASKALNSAEQGAAIGQLKLGKMYAAGEGVEQDNIYAYMWVSAAVIQGLGDSATDFKNELAKKMTASQIEIADNLYIECKKKSYKGC